MVRSIITRELLEKYNFSQKEVAEVLGVTQPAVSQYKRSCRGSDAMELEKNKKGGIKGAGKAYLFRR